jgi:sRNA-binding protein
MPDPQVLPTDDNPLPPEPAADTPLEAPLEAPDEALPAGTEAEAASVEEPAPEPTPGAEPAAPGMSPAACGARLAELFPALFGPEGPRKPIKLRIQADLNQRAPGVFTKRVLGFFLSRYTTTTAYLKALSTSPHRFDLDGQPAGEIAEEHRAAAVTELARRRELHEARRAAERAAARAAMPPRAERPAGPPRGERPPQGDRPPRADRPPRPPRPEQRGRPERAPQRPAPERREAAPAMPPAPPEVREPLDPARRDRALLLRQFETSPLTKANFCVLKRISEAELDAQLVLARAERPASMAPLPPARRRP